MSIYQTQSSPLGELLLVGEETKAGVALTSVSLPGQRNAPDIGVGWQRAPGAFALVTRQVEEYFASERTHFDLVLAPSGTPFQQRIWQALDSVGTAPRSPTASSPLSSASRGTGSWPWAPRSAPTRC